MKAVFENADLLRASIVSAGNEYRLGANEAPPAIISIFLGSQLSKMLEDIETKVSEKPMTPDEKTAIKLDIGKIPDILLDNTDRNRTSPFAFTGNRFEFRAVGSSGNCAAPMIALNTAVAKQLKEFHLEVEELIEKGVKKDEAILQVIRKYIIESKAIHFDGNGYSKEWEEEAAKRGLTNIKNVAEALKHYLTDKTINLMEEMGVLSRREMEARYEVRIEKYTKQLQIESRVLADLSVNHIVPTAIAYQNVLIENIKGLKEIFSQEEYEQMTKARKEVVKTISSYTSIIKEKSEAMRLERKAANKLNSEEERKTLF